MISGPVTPENQFLGALLKEDIEELNHKEVETELADLQLQIESQNYQEWARIKSTVGGIISLLNPDTEAGSSRWQDVIYGRRSNNSTNLDTLIKRTDVF